MSFKFKKMMAKMKQKLGFSLIEMLVVIAIIAILVSIIVPMISTSVQKSAAATNAANLRAIEGKLSVMRVENPQLFEHAEDQFVTTAQDFIEDSSLSWAAKLHVITNLLSFAAGESYDPTAINYAQYYVYHNTADENGVLHISVEPPVTLTDVPASEKVTVSGMELPEGVPMTVYVSNHGVLASYEYGGNSYTKDDFAYVIENGTFEGQTASGGLTGEGITGELECASGNHLLANGVCKCSRCDTPMDHPAHTTEGVCVNCGATGLSHSDSPGYAAGKDGSCDSCGTHVHYDQGGNGVCKFCNYDIETNTPHSHTYVNNTCVCDTCKNSRCNHSWGGFGTCSYCKNWGAGCPNCNILGG